MHKTCTDHLAGLVTARDKTVGDLAILTDTNRDIVRAAMDKAAQTLIGIVENHNKVDILGFHKEPAYMAVQTGLALGWQIAKMPPERSEHAYPEIGSLASMFENTARAVLRDHYYRMPSGAPWAGQRGGMKEVEVVEALDNRYKLIDHLFPREAYKGFGTGYKHIAAAASFLAALKEVKEAGASVPDCTCKDNR